MDKKLKRSSTAFSGLYIIEPNTFEDQRGAFSRIYCEDEMQDIFTQSIKQINHSITKEKGTWRGLHFQYEPYAEVKMLKCIKGSVLDIVVDIRKNSPTFLKVFSLELSQKNQKMLCIPKGFAHGFQTLEDDTELLYLHSNVYSPLNEGGLNIKDPLLCINLPLEALNISQRDIQHPFLTNDFIGIEIDAM
jgi:dTDP-4-dehydrorhamnose 3,5-epimerase